jgi:hypothetical protein
MEESDQDEIQPNAIRKSYRRNSGACLSDLLESLCVWIFEKPHLYARHIGELHGILGMIHMVWATSVNRDADYFAARETTDEVGGVGLLSDEERLEIVDLINPTTQKVLNYWQIVDRELQIQQKCDAWYVSDYKFDDLD